MQLRKWITWGGAAALAAAALGWAFAPRPVLVEVGAAEAARFEQAIEEDGRTRLLDRYTVSTPVAARLARIALREGDAVAAGDTVAMLLPVLPTLVDERALREAQARHGAAAAGVQRAEARMARTRIAAEEAQLELQRTGQLAREGFVAAARMDAARLAAAAAAREHEAARAERSMAMQEQAQAAALLQPAGRQSTPARPLAVAAPAAGVVLKVAQPSEATLPAGTALLEIGDPARLEVVADLLTPDAVLAQPGRRAVVERWGGPALQGRVRRVEPAAFTKVSALGIEEQRVRVIIALDAPPAAWKAVGDGFRVTVRILTQELAQATVVSVGALFPDADGGLAVYRLQDGRARLQPVEIAGRNASHAWVRSGLQPGQPVILYPPPAVVDGRRVRQRER